MEKKEIDVSVIIPVYNGEKYIYDCIMSIVKQEICLECIIIDDGSTDKTYAICEKIGKEYNNVFLYRKVNEGVSRARNYGLEKAMGRFIVFVDADDYLANGALSKLHKTIQEVNVDVVFGHADYVYNDRVLERNNRIVQGIYTFTDLSNKLLDDGTLTGILFGSVWGAMYKKEIILGNNIQFPEKVRKNEDGIFNLLYLMKCQQICVLNEPTVYYYRQWKVERDCKFELDNAFEQTELYLHDNRNLFGEISNWDLQVARRKLTVAFWNSLQVQYNIGSYKSVKEYLKKQFECEDIKKAYKLMQYKEMNRFKKILVQILKHRLYFIYYVSIRYVYNFLKDKVKR